MKKFVKLISLVLALLMVAAAFAACDKGGDKDKDKDKESVATTNPGGNVTGGDTKVPDLVVMDWEGQEYRILGKESTTYPWARHFEVWCGTDGEMPEDVMGKAVWERNQEMLQDYGIDVVGYLDEKCNDLAKTALESGEDLYDLMLLSPEAFNPFAIEGKLIDIRALNYINLDHDGWMDYPNENLTMGGKLFYTTNKFLVQDKNRYWGVFYNRDMADELNLGYFEEFVFDGTWTIDKVTEIAKEATYEKDGQPGLGKGDNWGAGCSEYYNITQLAYGVGFRISEIGQDGYPYLVGATDDIMARLDKVFALVTNPDAYWCDQRHGTIDWKDCADQMFHRGNILVEPVVLSELQTVGSKISFEFGVLPNPKYDEKQEKYHTIPNLGNGSLLGVPITVYDDMFAGYALELITEKSVDSTYRAYIEVTCKLQKVQDDDAAKCLEIIYDGVVYDLAFVSNLGGIGKIFWNQVVGASTNNWKRMFDRNEGVVEAAIEAIREAYRNLDAE